MKEYLFLDYFPNHKYRYLDTTGLGRIPRAVSSEVIRDDLNKQGYCSYFTVNGFQGADATVESMTNINAFFIDIDGRKDEKEIEGIKTAFPPTFIVETARGYHIYWLLDEPLYKEDMNETEWKDTIARWQRTEKSIVARFGGDTGAQDIARILRVPGTYYWKDTADLHTKGTAGAFRIRGIHKVTAMVYTMSAVEEQFPPIDTLALSNPAVASQQKYSDEERENFFARVDKEYPVDDRDSFKALVSGKAGTLAPNTARHEALLITATLMRDAGWKEKKALEHIKEVGWHGLETERGRKGEIEHVIRDAYRKKYHYSYKHPIIDFVMSARERQEIQEAYMKVLKARKDTDKVRYSVYENEVLTKYPYLKKNEIGLVFNYENGVYRILSDLEVSDIILSGLSHDMLWGFRTKKNVADKVACLLSIIPKIVLSDDGGKILNVRNGLLNIVTREFTPHSPNYVTLVQFPIDYDPLAVCPVWEKCIDDWVEGEEDEGKKRLLQEFAGYCATSSMQYDKALFLIGDGANGKSTFVDTISRVIGRDAVSHIDLEGLYGQYGMKGLIGKRLNIIEEVQGNYYHSNKLKKLISGEMVTIDIKYKDQFTFRPQAKFIFAVNIMPRVDDTSTATERRTCIVSFNNTFRDNPNTTLRSGKGLLAQELSGILNWMLAGAMMLREAGKFTVTDEQTRLLAEYRQENSSVDGFIAECLDFGEGYSVPTREVFDEYREFCQKDGRKFKSNISFTKEMKAYGQRTKRFTFKEREHGSAPNHFVGVKINNKWSPDRQGRVDYNDI